MLAKIYIIALGRTRDWRYYKEIVVSRIELMPRFYSGGMIMTYYDESQDAENARESVV